MNEAWGLATTRPGLCRRTPRTLMSGFRKPGCCARGRLTHRRENVACVPSTSHGKRPPPQPRSRVCPSRNAWRMGRMLIVHPGSVLRLIHRQGW